MPSPAQSNDFAATFWWGTSAGLGNIRAKLAMMLVHVANGEWASLERGEPELRPAAKGFALQLVRTVLVAGFPLAVALALRFAALPFEVDQDVVDGRVRFGIGWPTYHALVAIDSQVVEKIGSANTVLNVLPT